MKKKLCLTVLCFAALTACNNEQITIEDIGMPTTRAIVDQNRPSTSNPELLTNWENLSEVTLNSGSLATLPWIDGTIAYGGEEFRKDIKKEDGWDMLFHTFDKYNIDLGQNYMCFYNKLTGTLKFFYYYERGGIKNYGTQWKMEAQNNTKLFDVTEYLAKAANETAATNEARFSNMMGKPNTGMETGWAGFEFEAAYCQDFANMMFSIGGDDKIITAFEIHGQSTLKSLGTITTETVTSEPKRKNAIATAKGNSAKGVINGLSDSRFLSGSLKDAIASIPTKGIVSAIKGGLKKILGKTTTRTSKSTSISEVNITTTGTINLEGIGTTNGGSTGISPISFNLYNILNPNGESPSEGHYLGTWRLTRKPVIQYQDFVKVDNVRYSGTSIEAKVPCPPIVRCDYTIEVNPDIKPYITNMTHNLSYVICDKLQGEPYGGYEINQGTGIIFDDGMNVFSDYDEYYRPYKEISGIVSTELNQEAQLFYEWEPVTSGKMIAVIDVEITYNYNGKEIVVNQTRCYDVDYTDDAETRAIRRERYERNPEMTAIINDYMW